MKQPMLKTIGTSLLRSVALFFTFGLIVLVSRFIFKGNLFDEEMLSERAVAGWNTAFLLFIFESAVFAFNRHATEPKRLFSERFAPSGQPSAKLKSVLLGVDFYVELACVVLLSLALPLSFAYECVGVALFGETGGKGRVLLVLLPVLLLLELFAHLSVRSAWISDSAQIIGKKKDTNDFARMLGGIALTATSYCAAALVIPWFLPFLVTIANLGAGAVVFLYIALAIVAAALTVAAAFYVRAVRKRQDFVRKLKKYCEDNALPLSEVQAPCASVFLQRSGVDFTLEDRGAVYDCKLVAGIFPGSPMVFSDTGMGIRRDTLRLFRVDLLHFSTLLDYRMEDRPAENRKFLIVLPVPKRIYVSVAGGTPRPADTGEPMGEYTLYTAVGFLNALERGTLSLQAEGKHA